MELIIIFSAMIITTYFAINFADLSNTEKKKSLFSTELIFKYNDKITLTIFDEEKDDKIVIIGENDKMKSIDKNQKTFYFEYFLSEDRSTIEYWVFVVSNDKQIFSERLVAKLKDNWGNNLI